MTSLPTSASAAASLSCRAAQTPEELNCSITLHYLAEGAANVVYKIHKHNKNDTTRAPIVFVGPRVIYHPTTYLGQVLRVSKGLDKTITAKEIKRRFDHDIEPLFDTRHTPNYTEHLMNIWLVHLDDSVLPALDAEISHHSTRYKGTIPTGSRGLIMEDMSSEPQKSLTIEIKPKWLAQSPNAPSDVRRCRTCALQAFKHAKGKANAPYICPLQILAGKSDILEPYVIHKVNEEFARLGEAPGPDATKLVSQAIVDYLAIGKGHGLLLHLKALQLTHDAKGVRVESHQQHDIDDLRLAMTLRDCSLFIRMAYNGESILSGQEPLIDAKLGDLDFKSAAKIDDWRMKEEKLVEGGWYENTGEVPWAHGDCALAGDNVDKDS